MFKSTPISVVLTTLAFTGGNAMGDVIVVRPSSQIIISNNVEVGVFRDVTEPITRAYDPDSAPFPDSIRFWFFSATGGVTAGIHANTLPNGAWGYPPQTPSLTPDNGLDLWHTSIGPSNSWIQADISDDGDSFRPAGLGQSGIFGDFQLEDFGPGESAYVGFSNYELTKFGYVQIRRVGIDVLTWELVGYAYDDSGNPVYVEDLYVPGVSTLMPLLATGGMLRIRRR